VVNRSAIANFIAVLPRWIDVNELICHATSISANESRCSLGVYGVAVTFRRPTRLLLATLATPGSTRPMRAAAPSTSGNVPGSTGRHCHLDKEPVRISPKTVNLKGPVIPASLQTLLGLAPVLSHVWPHPLMAIELLVVGVGQPVMNAWRGSWSSRSFPSRCAVFR
jgi:hypothetical protein